MLNTKGACGPCSSTHRLLWDTETHGADELLQDVVVGSNDPSAVEESAAIAARETLPLREASCLKRAKVTKRTRDVECSRRRDDSSRNARARNSSRGDVCCDGLSCNEQWEQFGKK